MYVIGSDKIKGEGRVRNETNYKDNSRHFLNLIKKKSNKAKLLNKGKKGENEERDGGREGRKKGGRKGRIK